MWFLGTRRFGRIAADLVWVGLSAFLAITIRENFQPSAQKLDGVVVYSVLCVLSAAIVFSVARLQRTLWRYTSLADVLHVAAAVTVALLLALLGAFTINRLEGVARSLPVIQWFLLVGLMVATRVVVRIVGERLGKRRKPSADSAILEEHVLIVGLNDLTELYLRSAAEFAPSFVIVGILTEGDMRGRSVRKQQVLGAPKDIQRVIDQLDIHGVPITRVTVTEPWEKLSKETQDALREVERVSALRVNWLVEDLGLKPGAADGAGSAPTSSAGQNILTTPRVYDEVIVAPSRYHAPKRIFDALGAMILAVLLAPILLLTALFVALDVGVPVVFWQQRPGKGGRSFRLYKFRTMRAAHDSEGNRIPDELRSSSRGRFLRRTRLDELPQLYNILVGEMSFVGPRPLLPIDQPECPNARLLVRPGLTGVAQINGGRDMMPAQKAIHDLWYIENASPWLDIRIVLHTVRMMVFSRGPDGFLSQAGKGTPSLENLKYLPIPAQVPNELAAKNTRSAA